MAKRTTAVSLLEDSKPKMKRERIQLIETEPKDDWFVRSKTAGGRVVWYLRFSVTGMCPRLFGPFKSKTIALFFLDVAINAMCDFEGEIRDECEKRAIHERYRKVWTPIIEDPLVFHHGARRIAGTPKGGHLTYAPAKKGR